MTRNARRASAEGAAGGGAAEDEALGEQEVPDRRDLGCEQGGCEHAEAEPVAEGDQRERVDRETADPDEAEAPEARRRRAQAEPPDESEVPEHLSHRRLALTRRPLPEPERDLRDRELRRADEDLEQDLETVRAQGGKVERTAPDKEEARERIAHAAQTERKGHAGETHERTRDERPHPAQPFDRAAAEEAGGDHEVALLLRGLRAQRRDLGRRVLEVGVHHTHPRGARGRDSCHDGAAEPTVTLSGRAVDDRHLEPCRGAALGDDGGGIVVGVVDDDELGAHAREFRVEAVDERADDVLLVARRSNDRQLRSARARAARALGRGPAAAPSTLFSCPSRTMSPVARCHAGVRLLIWFRASEPLL